MSESFRGVTSCGPAFSCHFSVYYYLIMFKRYSYQVSTKFLFLSFLSEVLIATILFVLCLYMSRILSFLIFSKLIIIIYYVVVIIVIFILFLFYIFACL
jgi:hypothetical protein